MKNLTYIIAEIGVNHNGNVQLAKQMIAECKKCGANAVKFQTYKASRICDANIGKANYQKNSSGIESQYQMLKKYELNYKDFRKLKQYADKIDIDFLTTIADKNDVDFLINDLKMQTIKIGSSDLTNIQLLIHIGMSKKKVIISTGMSTDKEIDIALSALSYGYYKNDFKFDSAKHKNYFTKSEKYLSQKITILHCTTEYPAPVDELNLNVLETMRNKYKCKIGYSDHSANMLTPIIAVTKKACIIEVHVTKSKKLSGPDHKSSLNFKEFLQYIKNIRMTEIILGIPKKIITKSEKKNMKHVLKKIFCDKTLESEAIISDSDIFCKRSLVGIPAYQYSNVINKKTKKKINENQAIKNRDIK